MLSLSTVPRRTTLPFAATVPFSTLATNSAADRPWVIAVASHGPLMPCPLKIFLTVPLLSMTNRHPGDDVAAWPFFDGRLPTMTQPCTRTRAVVRPTPPGQRPGSEALVMCVKTVRCPLGLISTIVDPVPCRFLELLKLLTRMSPRCKPALALPDHHHPVRIDVTVGRDGRCDPAGPVKATDEGMVNGRGSYGRNQWPSARLQTSPPYRQLLGQTRE